MVLPAVTELGPVTIQRDTDNITITWEGGILQRAENLTGTFETITGATSPYTVNTDGSQAFFRTVAE